MLIMELVLLTIIGLMLAWWLGLFDSFKRGVRMATREVILADSKHKTSVADEMSKLKIDEKIIAQAKTNQALLDSIDF
jgi:hypothetical protein